MRALQNLARFIRAKDTADERQEIREYATVQAAELADAFGLTVSAFYAGIEGEADDARLAQRLLSEVKRATAERRDAKISDRVRAAQGSADVLGSIARWDGDRAVLDVVSLLASALTRRDDVLTFSCESFAVSIPMGPLFDVLRLERFDLTGFVDAHGLHLRWGTGGLNFRSRLQPTATSIIVHLPAHSAVLAA